MFESILVVCVGNICRSPTGERLLKSYIPNKRIDSAGIGALVGQAADEMAQHVASTHSLSLEGHVAKQLTKEMCREFSLILVMEKGHIDAVCRLAPEVRGKTMLFAHWLNQQDVPDPYRKSQESFEFVYKLLAESAQKWSQALNR
ncbi:arsenate reductase/protein-tyrosine-phosphatase family protein [Serratia liquefaciens]|jgi:protein-tyrosine phosphatase|uniref:arsenate reductase/protein-tyrosine-phosphatase family protein n=1 Tax=Serratia liquefaciens TaxID=614 RepID=UPI000DFE3DA1|nr:protein tyrosine phosphatase [Serratia liquefaciens]MBF8104343.1 protein tyrosine phosphatase [Serratia liquefaciens]RYM87455.1 protein tyrosine phosphatase [Serratia liquefaciens]CAB1212556.1 Low molecular weight protein-tyrosine-phosphatase Wzb [Serratia liquefaciens]CAI1728714.1 Low molecular weight protein-tyrosine-phosphatase wzb [Serratia liquefaciens]CAI1749583.1 Low molecular weight protein-tyrosine-phosphatase wzb [Serratia liquefaciens]